MAFGVQLSRDFFAYISDDGVTYVLATTDDNATAQSANTPISPSAHATYPRGFVPRYVLGAILDGSIVRRTKLPIFDPSNALWVGGTGTFDKSGLTGWVVEGRIGERRTHKGG